MMAWHCRSDVTVGATVWNSVALHVFTAAQFPFTLGLNVWARMQVVHARSDEVVGERNCCVPAGQLLTFLHAELDASFLYVDPATHDVHTRSLDSVGATVWP